MEMIVPRYEFRWFGQDIDGFIKQLKAGAEVFGVSESREVYILSTKGNRISCKMRNESLDVKELLGVEDGLERWTVKAKEDFPVQRDVFEDEILPLLGINLSLRQEEYDMDEVIDKIVPQTPELTAVHVHKRRYLFNIGECKAEYADLLVNGAFIRTLCIESESLEELKKLRSRFGLDDLENISYLGALKRITGMVAMVNPPSLPPETT